MTTNAATHGASWPNNLFLLQRWQETLHPYMIWIFCSTCFSWFGFVLTTYQTYQRILQDFSLPEKESLIRALPPTFTICESTQATALPVHTRIPTFNRVLPPSQPAMGEPSSQDNCNSSWRSHRATLYSSHRRARQTSETLTIPIWLLLPHRTTQRMCRDPVSDIHSIALLPKH